METQYDDPRSCFINEGGFFQLLSSNKKILFVAKESKISRLRKMDPFMEIDLYSNIGRR